MSWQFTKMFRLPLFCAIDQLGVTCKTLCLPLSYQHLIRIIRYQSFLMKNLGPVATSVSYSNFRHMDHQDSNFRSNSCASHTGSYLLHVKQCEHVDELLDYLSAYGNTVSGHVYAQALVQLHKLLGQNNKRGSTRSQMYIPGSNRNLAYCNPKFKICVEQLQERIYTFQLEPLLTILNMLKCLGVTDSNPVIHTILHSLVSGCEIKEFNLNLEDAAFGLVSLSHISTSDIESTNLTKELVTVLCTVIDKILLSATVDYNPLIQLPHKLLTGLTLNMRELSQYSQEMLLKIIHSNVRFFTPTQANAVLRSLEKNKSKDSMALYSKLASPVITKLNHEAGLSKQQLTTVLNYYHYLDHDMQLNFNNCLLEKMPVLYRLDDLLHIAHLINQQHIVIAGLETVIGHLLAMHFRSNDELHFDLVCTMLRMFNEFESEIQDTLLTTVIDHLGKCGARKVNILYTRMTRGNNLHPLVAIYCVKYLQEHFSKRDVEDINQFSGLVEQVNRLDIRARQRLIMTIIQNCHNMSPDEALRFLIFSKQGRLDDIIVREALCDVFSRKNIKELTIKHVAQMQACAHCFPDKIQERIVEELKLRCENESAKNVLPVLISYKDAAVKDNRLVAKLADIICSECHRLRLSEVVGFVWALTDLGHFPPNINNVMLEVLDGAVGASSSIEELMLCLDIIWCVSKLQSNGLIREWQVLYVTVIQRLQERLKKREASIDYIKLVYLPHLLEKLVLLPSDVMFDMFEMLSVKFGDEYFHTEQIFVCLISLKLSLNMLTSCPSNRICEIDNVDMKRKLIADIIEKGIFNIKSCNIRKADVISMVHSNFIYVHHCLQKFPQYDEHETDFICSEMMLKLEE